MKNNQKGFIGVAVLFIVLAIAGIAGYYFVSQNVNRPTAPTTQVSNNFDQNDTYPSKPQNEVSQLPVTSPKQQENPTSNNQPKPTPTVTPKPTPTPTNPTPSPAPATMSSKIDSCRTISTAGEYSLSTDLTNTKSEPCIKIQNVSNVTLDCQNHTITSKNENYNIYVKGSTNFKINNCKLVSSVSLPSEATQHVFRVEDSKQGEVNNNTFGGNFVSISGSSLVTAQKNIFTNQFNVYKSNNVIIRENNFSGGVVPLTFQGGHDNSAISNFIDGKSDGIFKGLENSVGSDDGIVINDESGDLIQGNTLQNFFDCAIENTGYMFDTKIIGNKASNAGVCFLGGWYYSSVKGISVRDNVVSNMPNLFYFFRQYALKSTEQYVYFQNNTFENNKLSNPKTDTGFSMASRFVFDGSAVPLQNHILGNNILRNNDFTKSLGPLRLSPKNIVTDGGGNICSGAEEEAKGGGDAIPFNCN